MKKKALFIDKIAVAGVIEFLLLIGLFAIVLSMIQLNYIPEIMQQNEADHMDEISNQFSRLKAMMEIQAKEKTEIPLSNIITLGNSELPYLVSLPSRGYISVIGEGDTDYEIKINDVITYPLTSIKYESHNLYFVKQTYILEAGGVIIKQPEGNPVMWADPPLNATAIRDPSGHVVRIEIRFDIPVIICDNENYQSSGLDFCYVRTNYSDELSDNDWIYLTDIDSVNISSEYSHAWYNYINKAFEKDVKNNITYYQGPSYTAIEDKGSISLDIYYRKSCIYARVD